MSEMIWICGTPNPAQRRWDKEYREERAKTRHAEACSLPARRRAAVVRGMIHAQKEIQALEGQILKGREDLILARSKGANPALVIRILDWLHHLQTTLE